MTLQLNPLSIKYYTVNYNPTKDCIEKIATWRDRNPTIARKVVAGPSLAIVGLGALIDAVLSAVCSILTSPLSLFGNSIPSNLMFRACFNGLYGGAVLTVGQFYNIVDKKLN